MCGSNEVLKVQEHRQIEQNLEQKTEQNLQAELTTSAVQTQGLKEKQIGTKKGVTSKISAALGFDKPEITPMEEYSMTQKEMRNNYSDIRGEAFHEHLAFICHEDCKKNFSPQFSEMMKKIAAYVDAPILKTSYSKQCQMLKSARDAIKDYLEKHGEENAEASKIARVYQSHFDFFCDGNLEEEENESAIRIDAVTNAPKIDSALGSIASYRDAEDEQLFPHEPSANDVCQRLLGDCYLQAGLASMTISDPQMLKSCMKDNRDGTVTVRFFKKGYDNEEELPQEIQKAKQEKNVRGLDDIGLVFRMLLSSTTQDQNAYRNFQKVVRDSKAQEKKELEESTEYQRLTEEEKQERLKETKTATSFSDMKEFLIPKIKNIDGWEHSYKLAQSLTQNPVFQEKVLNKMRRFRDETDLNLEEILTQGLLDFWSLFQNDQEHQGILSDETTALLNAAKNQEPMTHKIYVRVKKEVPSLLGGDLHSANCLWVQMIEKAYAASGLHNRQEVNELYLKMKQLDIVFRQNRITKTEYEKQMKQYKVQWEKLHSFDAIQGGYTSDFLEYLTGVTSQKLDQTMLTPGGNSLAEILFDPECTNKLTHMEEIKNSAMWYPLAQKIFENIDHYLVEKLGVKYKKKNKEEAFYLQDCVHIEDITEAISSVQSWITKYDHNFEQDLQGIIAVVHEQQEINLEGYLEHLVQAVEDYLKTNDKIHYRKMSGKYTPSAIEKFQLVERSLNAGIPVSCGSYRFVPPELAGGGLNGEAATEGVVEGHAYSVMGVMEKEGKKFVKLRNPWSQTEMQYVKVSKSDGTTSISTKAVNNGILDILSTSKNKGTFYMEWNDFLSKTDDIYFNSNRPILIAQENAAAE